MFQTKIRTVKMRQEEGGLDTITISITEYDYVIICHVLIFRQAPHLSLMTRHID